MLRKGDLTQGGITGTLLHFTLPMMVGSFLQQCYNIADTLIVGQCIGAGALAMTEPDNPTSRNQMYVAVREDMEHM